MYIYMYMYMCIFIDKTEKSKSVSPCFSYFPYKASAFASVEPEWLVQRYRVSSNPRLRLRKHTSGSIPLQMPHRIQSFNEAEQTRTEHVKAFERKVTE